MAKPVRKSLFFVLCFFLCIIAVEAQTSPKAFGSEPYWFTLEQGKVFFRNQDYGNALVAFEDARQQRKNMYAKMEQNLITVLSLPEVRRFNGSLSELETYAFERSIINVSKILDELYYRVSKETLNDSSNEALKALGTLQEYPEAEYWIGEVFRAEGELGVALKQYERAYNLRSSLEIPDFSVEILYKIAALRKIRQEYTLMENAYLEILKNDTLWSGSGTDNVFVKNSMNRILENDGLDQFLLVYRYDNYRVEKAHRELGLYYYSSGRHAKAVDHLLFAFLIQNSIIIQNLLKNQFDYSFTNAEDLFDQIMIDEALMKYAAEVEYYKTIYYLGGAFYGNGNLTIASNFWNLLINKPEAGEWSSRAESQLQSPFIEKITEMP
jgi:tetratricopeptide (TPR) repeat protein